MVSRASTLVAQNHVPEGWLLHVHPQGWIYFSNPSLKIVTDQDARIPEVYEILQKAIQLHLGSTDSEEAETHMQVTRELQASGPGVGALSLVIDHLNCIASYEWEDVKSFEDLQTDLRVLNRRRRLYWNFLWNHPSHVSLPSRALPEARDALLWYITDNLISGRRSVVPFSKVECDDLGKVLKDLSDPSYDRSPAKTVFVSWFLREVCSFRDSEQYGTHTPKQAVALRQEVKNSSPTIARPPAAILPLLNLVIRVFFFGIPLIYLSHVRKSSEYRGRLANVQQNWEHYIERLVREYAHFLLISTVLLSCVFLFFSTCASERRYRATVGILSVSDILQPAKTAAIISALASLGSIIVGVVAIWRHQASTRTADSFTYMYNAQHNYLGYHGHAMILSLPPVLLVWAVVTFTAAILAYAMQEVNASDSLSAWMVLSLCFLILGLVFAALYTFSGLWRFQQRATSVFQRVRKKNKTSEDLEMA
ncbi:hypothetical protein B0H16DRAFT_1358888 [Mycena metata]|uniref:Uncharacterized protein n=1 Tax=Mycena metata TaxID=1033252 RepID=A0AAD7K9W9_9AGAR|nr:hypothetical protein B0H16DRAFT_1358888 [Mycena metata]